MDGRQALINYVDAHNEGVRSGNFSRLIEMLEPACQMHFTGIRAGPYIGRDAIAEGFTKDPPGAELHILDVKVNATHAEALYGWVGAAATVSGRLQIELGSSGIRRILVRPFVA